ncbi:MAG: hypothetical protein JJT94_03740, partial [Bernardetiaceae bacterium]|nr:hypothetical protein [Bernardetiaceae bacterium]
MRIYLVFALACILFLSSCQSITRQLAGVKNPKEVSKATVFTYAEKHGIPKEDMLFFNISIVELNDTTQFPKLRQEEFSYMIYDSVGNCLYDPWSQNCGVP